MKAASLLIALLVITLPTAAQAIDLSRSIVLDVPPQIMEAQFGRIPPSLLTAEDSAAMAAYRFTADTVRLLVILVDWDLRVHTFSRETFDSLIFSRNVYPSGSVADYYDEVSYGQVAIEGDVIEWFDGGDYTSYYDFEQLLPQLDPFIDFSQYDGDGDGSVDAVTFVRAGTGQEDTGDPNDIWSYAMVYNIGSGPGPFDGVRVSRWNTSPELFPLRDSLLPTVFTGVDTLCKIRVFCHELSHNLGLPDLYDYDAKLVTSTYYTPNDDNDHPFVDWCLMGYAGYGLLSIRCDPPTHLSGWCKKEMGWVTPIVLDEANYSDLVIYDIETHQDSSLYKIPINPAEGEYFLLEYRNRNATGMFDKFDSDFSVYFFPHLKYGVDPLERGLLISHVHDSLGAYYWRINAGTPGYPHYTVAVEDAGYTPASDYTTNPGGHVSDSAQWWYPYETRKAAPFTSEVPGKNVFGPNTIPSSDGYFGPTGVTVMVDSIVDDRLYVTIGQSDSDDDGIIDVADNCPDIPNPTQDDNDFDGLGNVCDNCPDSANASQADGDSDGTGDACDNCEFASNPGQEDEDVDFVGDLCDNCPQAANTDQADTDGDTFGDACDLCPPIATVTNDPLMTGDVNQDDVLTSGDVIYLVNYSFKGGPPPLPAALIGDVDCNGSVTSSDIIFMVNHVFKSGAAPCDVCHP